jgi:hypothetical protein
VPHQTPSRIAILGGDPSVSRAVALLLRGYGYDSFPIEATFVECPEALLKEIRLLLLLATSDTNYANQFLKGIESTSDSAPLPIITLSSMLHEPRNRDVRHVPWPCRTETLVGEIEATLSATIDNTGVHAQSHC